MNEGSTYIQDERLLLAQVAEGSETAFRQLYEAYRRRVFSYLLKITDSTELAEDGTQDIFLKIWSGRETLPEIDNFNAYIHRMARNQAYSGFRRKAKEALILAELRGEEAYLDDPLVSKEVRSYIQSVVNQLTPQQRKVYLLAREGGLKQEEIATELNLTLATVKKHMVDALRFLREEVGQNYGPQAVAIFVIYQL